MPNPLSWANGRSSRARARVEQRSSESKRASVPSARSADVPRWLTIVAASVVSACAGSVAPDVDLWTGTDAGAQQENEPPQSQHSDNGNDSEDDEGAGEEANEADDDEDHGSADTSVEPSVSSTSGDEASNDDHEDTPDAMDSPSTSERATLPVHRMTAAEYNNTVSALFGTTLTPADAFPAAGTSEFDANVGVLASLSQVSVQGYFNAARDLAQTAFADETLRSRIVTCDPSQGDEVECVSEIAAAFGARAFRRPLDASELNRYVGVYSDAREKLEFSHTDALQHMVRTLLSAPSFFLRIEMASGELPGIPTERLALASRLSYLLWTSMPDDELLAKAIDGSLSTPQSVEQEVDRMLEEPESAGFYRDFFGQWLGLRALTSHNPDPDVFPKWNGDVRNAMLTQAQAFFASFVDGSNDYATFLSAPHPQAPMLESFYDSEPEGVRAGFLTLPAFLTGSSLSNRTSPTSRATAVLGGLLCTNIAPPANVDIPDLSAQEGATVGDNIRERLAKHRESPDCASCHEVLDPIGLSLENFDAVGGYRTAYGNGSAVDASGEFNGQTFADSRGLVAIIADEERLASCPPTKLLTYALRRSLTTTDRELATTIAAEWQRGDFKHLVKLVTTSPAFLAVLDAAPGGTMMMKQRLTRRNLLRGAGVCLALPALPSLAPRRLRAQDTGAVRRFLLCSFPNGAATDWWDTVPNFNLDSIRRGLRFAARTRGICAAQVQDVDGQPFG